MVIVSILLNEKTGSWREVKTLSKFMQLRRGEPGVEPAWPHWRGSTTEKPAGATALVSHPRKLLDPAGSLESLHLRSGTAPPSSPGRQSSGES